MKKVPQPLLLFDGVCNLCNTSIQRIIKRDKNKKFIFASLQSDVGKEILLQFDEKYLDLDSIILLNKNQIHTKSTAIIKVFQLLGGIYSVAIVFYIIPRFMRDWMYDYIAKNRYKWYGKRTECAIPTKEMKSRFLG